MANQVTDNRTDIADGTSATGWEDIAGSALAVDTDIRYDTFSGSIGQYATTTVDATLYNNGSTGLFSSGDHAYLLINCGVVSLLHTKVNRGLAVRVTGATATDWAEFELFGRDEWPVTFDGGWAQIVVDIDELLASPTNTNGTPPTVGNIQRFGITFETDTVMPRMTDNIWVGGFRILGSATPALIVEGRDGGSADWDWDSIRSVAAVQLSAVLKPGPGGSFICRGPIQFGISDSSTHAFTESNKVLLWDFQEVMLDGFYGLSALGNSGGSTDIDFGLKTGTGDDATGAQGGVIQAADNGARFDLIFTDPDLDSVNFYGVTLVHGGELTLDDAAVSFISTLYIDCTHALISNSEQLRVSIIAANTADGEAFMETDDITDIVFSNFFFSDGHAIELNAATPTAQTNKGNIFSGYTNSVDSTDAAILNSNTGDLTISNTDESDLLINSYRDTSSGSVTIEASVTIQVTVLDGSDDSALEFAHVLLLLKSDYSTEVINAATNSSGIASTSWTGATGVDVEGWARNVDFVGSDFEPEDIDTTITSTGIDITVRLTPTV